jgi:hypothetical protein
MGEVATWGDVFFWALVGTLAVIVLSPALIWLIGRDGAPQNFPEPKLQGGSSHVRYYGEWEQYAAEQQKQQETPAASSWSLGPVTFPKATKRDDDSGGADDDGGGNGGGGGNGPGKGPDRDGGGGGCGCKHRFDWEQKAMDDKAREERVEFVQKAIERALQGAERRERAK